MDPKLKTVCFSEFVGNRCSDFKTKVKTVDKRKRKLYLICILSVFAVLGLVLVIYLCFPSINKSNQKSNNESFDDFNNECLKSHNDYRSIHGVQPLTLDSELVKVAEKRAQELILTDIFDHPNYKFSYGENLHYIMPYVKKYSCAKVVKPWYEEIKDYDFTDWRKSKGKIGHFTQVVWKSTQRVGCAQTYSEKSKRLYTVCNYSPPGNWINRYEQNVIQPVI